MTLADTNEKWHKDRWLAHVDELAAAGEISHDARIVAIAVAEIADADGHIVATDEDFNTAILAVLRARGLEFDDAQGADVVEFVPRRERRRAERAHQRALRRARSSTGVRRDSDFDVRRSAENRLASSDEPTSLDVSASRTAESRP